MLFYASYTPCQSEIPNSNSPSFMAIILSRMVRISTDMQRVCTNDAQKQTCNTYAPMTHRNRHATRMHQWRTETDMQHVCTNDAQKQTCNTYATMTHRNRHTILMQQRRTETTSLKLRKQKNPDTFIYLNSSRKPRNIQFTVKLCIQ